jgi:hypothetical protein
MSFLVQVYRCYSTFIVPFSSIFSMGSVTVALVTIQLIRVRSCVRPLVRFRAEWFRLRFGPSVHPLSCTVVTGSFPYVRRRSPSCHRSFRNRICSSLFVVVFVRVTAAGFPPFVFVFFTALVLPGFSRPPRLSSLAAFSKSLSRSSKRKTCATAVQPPEDVRLFYSWASNRIQ